MKNLKIQTKKGLIWSIINQFGKQSISFLSTLLLVRLLSPSDFGLLAMVLVITSYSTIIINYGFGQSIVQNNELTHRDLSSIFWFNLTIGVVFSILIFLSSEKVAAFYNEPELIPIAKALSGMYTIISLYLVPRALLEKRLQFRIIAIVETSGAIISSLVAIIMALRGFGVWALIAQVVSTQILLGILYLILSKWRPILAFQFSSIQKVGRFSSIVFYSSVLHYLSVNIDRFLIGRNIGKIDVGLYDKSYLLAGMPKRNMTNIILSVLFSSFSKIQHQPEKIKPIFLNAMKLVSLINFPIMIGLLVSTHSFVLTLFGEKWVAMIPFLRILSVVLLFESFNTLLGSIILARGMKKIIFKDATIRQSVVIIMALIGVNWGSLGVAYGILGASIFNFFLSLYHTQKATYIPAIKQLKNVKNIFFSAVLMGLIVYCLQYFIQDFLSVGKVLSLNILIGITTYIALLHWQHDRTISYLIQLIRSK